MGGTDQMRRFIYLDGPLVAGYLGQIQRGVLEKTTAATSSSSGKKVGVSLHIPGLPIGADAGGDKASSSGTSHEFGQVPESDFQRLYDILDAEGGIHGLSPFEDAAWEQLEQGLVIEMRANLAPPQVVEFLAVADDPEGLRELLEGEVDEGEVDEAMKAAKMMKRLFPRSALVAALADSQSHGVVVPLDDESLRVGLTDPSATGTVRVLGEVTRVFAPGDEWTVLDIADRVRLEQTEFSLEGSDDSDRSRVGGPAAVLHPIAIYP